MSSREYVAQMAGNASTFTTGNPFFELGSSSSIPLELLAFELTQESSTTSAMFVVSLARRSVTSATGLGTTITPAKMNGNDAASGASSKSGISTSAGSLTETQGRWGFNALNGLFEVYVPELRPILPVSQFWTFQFIGTMPTGAWSLNCYFGEML